MLQLGGILSNSAVRIAPRTSWWISAQHLFTSTIVTNPVTETESLKDNAIARTNTTATTSTISQTSNTVNKIINEKLIHESIKSAVDIEELLNIAKDNLKTLSQKHLSLISHTLNQWIKDGKLNVYDNKFQEINNLILFKTSLKKKTSKIRIPRYEENVHKNIVMSQNVNDLHLPSRHNNISEAEQIRDISVTEAIKTLTALARKQDRSILMIQHLATKISYSQTKLNIKLLADILYSVAVLNFYDEILLHKIKLEIPRCLLRNENSACVGSITKSLGMLRFKDGELLESITKWILMHQEVVRTQDCYQLLMTLAYLGFKPTDFPKFMDIVSTWNETHMIHSSEWLNVVWALSLLNEATEAHYKSVLNAAFLSRISDVLFSVSIVQKLLNINAAAKLLNSYKGPFIPENSEILKVDKQYPKDKILLSDFIISGLKVLLPSDTRYINVKVDSRMGFMIDAEFCLDSKCAPCSIEDSESDKNKNIRIAILSCTYADYCRGTEEPVGPIKFYKKLLESQGYAVMIIPYKDINYNDKLITRAKYINDNINNIMCTNSA